MPNEHGQITEQDFKAPSGQFRIMLEHMSDGELEIVADFHKPRLAKFATRCLVEEYEDDVFTLCDDAGREVDLECQRIPLDEDIGAASDRHEQFIADCER